MVYNRPTFYLRKNGKKNADPTKLEVLGENVLDAFVDGMIAGLSTGYLVTPEVGWRVFLAVFAFKFFVRLKELRGVG